MNIIRSGTKKRIEEILKDYPNMNRYIHERKQSLMYPTQEPDENVGGGKSSKVSRPQERMIITIDEDKQLKALEREQMAVKKSLDESDTDTNIIARELYFKEHPKYQMDGLIEDGLIYCGHTQAFQKKAKLIRKIAKEMGLYDPY
ncbi:transcriptional regulator [Companilactobacillus nuruki]|uniref:Transcriptional regulator n=1 Tax=Companilactobacillus nuruki TaxID=1993540 RepID=A0A2N7AV13_9LACO|nr:transcriptional regulator [Companilactobacillus nuruki]PMD71491.1 transcriptional regulator [Companilactobacillus nuruki]